MNTKAVDWHPEDIKAAIRKRGVTLQQLAKQSKVNRRCISEACYKPSKSGEIAIADFLGIELSELWPSRWTAQGERIYPRYAYLHPERGVPAV